MLQPTWRAMTSAPSISPSRPPSAAIMPILKPRTPREDLQRRARAVLARKSLEAFVRMAWHVVEPDTPLAWNWHIGLICRKLEMVTAFGRTCCGHMDRSDRGDGVHVCSSCGEEAIQNLVINIPPGHMKSLLVSVFWPAWEWLDKPAERSLFLSAADDVTKRDSVRTRDVITSDWYRQTVELSRHADEEVWTLATDQNTKINYKNTAQGYRHCMTIGGKVIGSRGDKVVVDDPYDVKEVIKGAKERVIERMADVVDIWDKVLSSRVNDKRRARRVLIMQRLHEVDLAGVLVTRDGYHSVILPARYRAKELDQDGDVVWTPCPDDIRTKPGTPLFEAMYPAEVLDEAEEELGSEAPAQLQQDPKPREGTIVMLDWTRNRWVSLPSFEGQWIWSIDPKMGSLDPDSSFFVAQLWFRPKIAPTTAYLVDQRREQIKLPDQIRLLKSLNTDPLWSRADVRLIEKQGGGQALLDSVGAFIPYLEGHDAGTRDKVARCETTTPFWRSAAIFLPEFAPWLKAFIGEITGFPASKWDDQVDAMSMAIQYLLGGVQVESALERARRQFKSIG